MLAGITGLQQLLRHALLQAFQVEVWRTPAHVGRELEEAVGVEQEGREGRADRHNLPVRSGHRGYCPSERFARLYRLDRRRHLA